MLFFKSTQINIQPAGDGDATWCPPEVFELHTSTDPTFPFSFHCLRGAAYCLDERKKVLFHPFTSGCCVRDYSISSFRQRGTGTSHQSIYCPQMENLNYSQVHKTKNPAEQMDRRLLPAYTIHDRILQHNNPQLRIACAIKADFSHRNHTCRS